MSNPSKIDLSKKYRYRNGQPARVLCIDAPSPRGNNQPVVALNEEGMATYHSESGAYKTGYSQNAEFDLIEVREPREFWLVLPNGGKGDVYTKRQDCLFPSIQQIHVREVLPEGEQ